MRSSESRVTTLSSSTSATAMADGSVATESVRGAKEVSSIVMTMLAAMAKAVAVVG